MTAKNQKVLDISYSADCDVLTIEGVRYSGDFFRCMGDPDKQALYEIIKQDGLITMNRVPLTKHTDV